MIYFNYRGSQGVETVDELDKKDFNTHKEYREERRRLLKEYRLSGMDVYLSQRSTKEWRNN